MNSLAIEVMSIIKKIFMDKACIF